MSHVLCTGNLCTKEQYTMLQNLSPNFLAVKGDFDDVLFLISYLFRWMIYLMKISQI